MGDSQCQRHVHELVHTHIQYAGMSTHRGTQERNNESWVDEQRMCRLQATEGGRHGRQKPRDDCQCILKNVVSCIKGKLGEKNGFLIFC